MKEESPFLTVARIQERFKAEGWRWQETTFNDGYGDDDVRIVFSPSHNCHAFTIGNESTSEESRYGWGRFPRAIAWSMAESFLLDEYSTNQGDILRLREYKAKWGV